MICVFHGTLNLTHLNPVTQIPDQPYAVDCTDTDINMR